MKNYQRAKGVPKCAITADLMKAYDSIPCDFILQCLTAVGVPAIFVDWVKECIPSASFSIALNGSLVGDFKGGTGLRQGDPLSSYLSVLGMEVFTRIMHCKVQEAEHFKFHPNDLRILSATKVNSIKVIELGIEEFRRFSGLCANPFKSEIFFGGVLNRLKESIPNIVMFKKGHLPVRYLGVPLISGKLRYQDCLLLLEKITC